jgi:AraC-like DNA-binding protein
LIKTEHFNELDYLCKLIHESIKLPVYCRINSDLQEESFWATGLPIHPLLCDAADLFRTAASKGTKLSGPVVHETNYAEQFAMIPVIRNTECHAVIIIGPTLRHNPSNSSTEFWKEHGIPQTKQDLWTEYYQSLPFVDRLRLLYICVSANWMINQQALDITDVIETTLQYNLPDQQQEKELELTDRREYSIFHEGNVGQSYMLELIKRGDKNELIRQLAKATNIEYISEVNSKRSHLRNVKNLAIGGVTISSHMAVQGGVYEELASTLCELHIKHIEELNDLAAVEAAVTAAIVDFADRVSQCRNNNVSKSVYTCKEFIYLHLFEEITMQQLSDTTELHPDYLSSLFKKETGLTVMNYIQRERVEEAKKLLDHSNDPIAHIGERLTFYDQSHFVKVFKKHAGMTPKQYRMRKRWG